MPTAWPTRPWTRSAGGLRAAGGPRRRAAPPVGLAAGAAAADGLPARPAFGDTRGGFLAQNVLSALPVRRKRLSLVGRASRPGGRAGPCVHDPARKVRAPQGRVVGNTDPG